MDGDHYAQFHIENIRTSANLKPTSTKTLTIKNINLNEIGCKLNPDNPTEETA